jgi:hypothetical protein
MALDMVLSGLKRRKQMNKTIEELQAAVEKAEANWMAAYPAAAAAARAAARACARADAADAAADAAWVAVFDAREAAKTALAEKESK